MLRVPLVDLKAQYASLKAEIDAAVARVVESGRYILGPEVDSFEREFAAYSGVNHCIGVSSGTDALHLALLACGVGRGDEVLTSAMSFIATAEAITMCGARPVFVDIDPMTGNLDPDQIEAGVTPRTRAILPVHLYGQPADMDPVLEIARRFSLRVVGDAAQAHGARYKGRPIGAIGDVACFSFYPGKNLGAYGDAGAAVTNDPVIAAQVRLLRDHGRREKYEHLVPGYGNRLDALQAAVLRAKLPHLESWNHQRQRLAAQYTELLSSAGITTPCVREWATSAWHLYVVRIHDRTAVRAQMDRRGIATGIHYPIPLHRQPAYLSLGHKRGDFPAAEEAAAQVLSLPLHPELLPETVEEVGASLLAAATGVRSE